MKFIILTEAQKDTVWSDNLQPRDLGDGRFILNPGEVLRDGEHPQWREFLASLPQEEVVLDAVAE